jgi:hypothetical protein
MVAWALVLLQTGIITLQTALKDKDAQDTLNLEVQKALKVRVQSSVIALLVVALGFLGLFFYYVQTNNIRPVTVIGEIQSEDNAAAAIYFSTQWSEVDTTSGEVRGEIWPKVDRVKVDIATPGHDPGEIITMAQPDKDHGERLYFKPVKNPKQTRQAMVSVYYGLLVDPASDKWTDFNFDIPPTASKRPTRGERLTANTKMNVRADHMTITGAGIEWPIVTGVLEPHIQVVVTDVKTFPTREGTHFWIKMRTEN